MTADPTPMARCAVCHERECEHPDVVFAGLVPAITHTAERIQSRHHSTYGRPARNSNAPWDGLEDWR